MAAPAVIDGQSVNNDTSPTLARSGGLLQRLVFRVMMDDGGRHWPFGAPELRPNFRIPTLLHLLQTPAPSASAPQSLTSLVFLAPTITFVMVMVVMACRASYALGAQRMPPWRSSTSGQGWAAEVALRVRDERRASSHGP